MTTLGREEELAASRNPFALVTQAFLSTRATQDDGELRRSWKLRIRAPALRRRITPRRRSACSSG